MKLVEVPLTHLNHNALVMAWAWMYDLAGLGPKLTKFKYGLRGKVKMDAHPKDGGHFIYKDDLPFVVLLDNGRKAYMLDFALRAGQDGSDLPLYEEVVHQSHLGDAEKDDETCAVIRHIDFKLINPLLEHIANNLEFPEVVQEDRRQINNAKFAAVTIWREGKLRKDAAPIQAK